MAFRQNGIIPSKMTPYRDEIRPCTSNGEKRFKNFLPKFPERVPNGSHFYGWVTHANDPFNFYVRLETGDSEKFKYLHAELQEEIPGAPLVSSLYQGMQCAGQINGQWGRAILEKYQAGNDHGEVFFIDTGHRRVVKTSELKELDDEFTILPSQAVLCHLGMLVTSLKTANAPWSKESIKYFKDLVEECFVNIFTVGGFVGGVGCMPPTRESKLYVAMYVGDDKLTVNSIMSRAGYGCANNWLEHSWHDSKRVSFRSSEMPPEFKMQSRLSHNILNGQQHIPKEKTKKRVEEPASSMASSLQSKVPNSQNVTKEDPRGSKEMPSVSIEVFVCHVVDPGKFYVRHQSFDMYNQYQVLINDTGPKLEIPWRVELGTNYAVMEEQSERWFRGKCLKNAGCTTLRSGTIYDFHLIDEGYDARIPMSSIRELSSELKSIRPMVWECCLDMDPPDNGWTKPIIEYFKKWIRREKCKMTVYNIRNGVRLVDLGHIPSDANEKATESAIKLLKAFKPDRTENSTIHASVEDVEPSKVKFVIDLENVKRGSCLKAQLVHITDPDEFYIHCENKRAGNFSFSTFYAQLQEEYNQPGEYEIDIPWRGFPYVVRYQGMWHRALVESVTSREDIAVFLVDTGVRLTTRADDIRHIQEKYMGHPVQVVQCKLYGVCSKNPSGRWSMDTVKYFKQMVDGISVSVCVEGVILGGVGKTAGDESMLLVVLYIEDEDVSVNTRLTRAGHGISVRQHDLPSHNRPKRSVPRKCISVPSLHLDDNGVLINGIGKLPANDSEKPTVAANSKTITDIDNLLGKAPAVEPVVKENDLDTLLRETQDIQSSKTNQTIANHVMVEGTVKKDAQKRGDVLIGVCDETWSSFAYSSLKSETLPVLPKPANEGNHIDVKPTIAIPPTAGATAGDIFGAEVALLECSYDLLGLDGRTRTRGAMPKKTDYVMSVKYLMCPSPQTIFVRPSVYESKYRDMNADLQRTYRTTKVSKMVHIEVGNRCAAFVYGQWVRAIVAEIDAELRCTITSIDSGQPHLIPYDQIYSLIPPFDSIPKLALKCSLLGVKSVDGLEYDNLIEKITSSLLEADDVFIYCSQRPKAIPSTLGVNIVFRRDTDSNVMLTNLRDWLLD